MKIEVEYKPKTEKIEIENFTKAHEEAKARLERWAKYCKADPDGARDYYNERSLDYE